MNTSGRKYLYVHVYQSMNKHVTKLTCLFVVLVHLLALDVKI